MRIKMIAWLALSLFERPAQEIDAASSTAAKAQSTAGNQDVLKMKELGLSEALIIAKIEASPVQYNVDTAALIELKTAGLSDDVIAAMVRKSTRNSEAFAPPAVQKARIIDKANVAIYRYAQFTGKGIRPSIVVDGIDIARIQSGRYLMLALEPGKHTFASSDPQSQVEIDLAPGGNYFFRIEIATGVWKGHGRLMLVMKEQGVAEVRKMQPADWGMIKDRSRLSPDFTPQK